MPLYRADVWTFTPPHTLHSLGELPTITDALNVCQAHTPELLRWHMPTQGRFFAVNSVAEYRIVRVEHPATTRKIFLPERSGNPDVTSVSGMAACSVHPPTHPLAVWG